MGFKTGAYATIWDVKTNNGNCEARISISYKPKDGSEYIEDFSGFVKCYGDAAAIVSTLQPRDRIKIGGCDVTSRYDKEQGKTYINFKMFTCEKLNSSGGVAPKPTQPDSKAPDSGDDDDLPF